jgi:hypothetical protein
MASQTFWQAASVGLPALRLEFVAIVSLRNVRFSSHGLFLGFALV